MLTKARAIENEIIRLRREIHRHPELAFQEVRTAALVADTLREIGGISIRTGVGKTGVVGEIGAGDGPTIAIRADMDALPIVEDVDVAFKSEVPGNMHACGHDSHTAILLGVAHLLKQEFAQGGLKGKVRLLFQPAEEAADAEGISGAPRMIEDGAMEGVDAVIALHVDSTMPVGTIGLKQGASSEAVDSFRGYITGSGGHGAYPHQGTDPLWMLLPVMQGLHAIVARQVDPLKPAVVSLGVVRGGTVSNVIPAEVYLEGTLRSFDPQVREQLIADVERAFAVARHFGGDYRLQIERGYPAGANHPEVTGWMESVVTDLVGAEAIDKTRAGMGAEDFAYMTKLAPGAMFNLGAQVPDGTYRAHHTPIFALDESSFAIGAAVLAETARRFLAGETR
jgi:amidohydrolase